MKYQKLTPEEWKMFEDYLLGLDQQGCSEFKQQMKEDALKMYPDLKQQMEAAE